MTSAALAGGKKTATAANATHATAQRRFQPEASSATPATVVTDAVRTARAGSRCRAGHQFVEAGLRVNGSISRASSVHCTVACERMRLRSIIGTGLRRGSTAVRSACDEASRWPGRFHGSGDEGGRSSGPVEQQALGFPLREPDAAGCGIHGCPRIREQVRVAQPPHPTTPRPPPPLSGRPRTQCAPARTRRRSRRRRGARRRGATSSSHRCPTRSARSSAIGSRPTTRSGRQLRGPAGGRTGVPRSRGSPAARVPGLNQPRKVMGIAPDVPILKATRPRRKPAGHAGLGGWVALPQESAHAPRDAAAPA